MENKPEIAVGATVLYYPHLTHALDVGFDKGGQLQQLFHWHHAKAHQSTGKDAAGNPVKFGVSEGDAVDWSKVGEIKPQNPGHKEPAHHDWHDGAHLIGLGGLLRMRPGKPKFFWEATVIQVNPDGSCDLSIKHPNGFVTLTYPDRPAHRDAAARHREEAARQQKAAADSTGDKAAYCTAKGKEAESEAVKADKRAASLGVPYDPTKTQHHSFHLAED